MSRYTGPKTKILRALGVDLPGLTTRSHEKRPYPPGEHGHKRRKYSEYAVRVMETKKLRFNYGVSEKYLSRTIQEAQRSRDVTTHKVIELLERRLDNVIFRAGFAPTIPAARQMVCHGHILVAGRRVDIPSFRVKAGHLIQLKNSNRELQPPRFDAPEWLQVNSDEKKASILALPDGTQTLFPIDMKLVIEHYSTRL
ncbi:MAG: 30S ribosomal protein S4 [Polyangiaceae bacterium]|nr:30S ribosomal protein S4 [Polyangiaceae bacterium]